MGLLVFTSGLACNGLITVAPCTDCRMCCGFDCLSFDNTTSCKISDRGNLPYPREIFAGVCYHHAKQCISCAADPNSWQTDGAQANTEIVVSADCHFRQFGAVEWENPVTLQSSLSGPALLRGHCPLIRLLQNATIRDITFDCLSGNAAIDIVDGRGVTLSNVSALHASVFRAAHVEGVSLDGFKASVSSNHRVIAAIGNGMGKFEIDCMTHGTVVTQTRSTAAARYGVLCDAVDLGLLLDVYGRDYETMFYYKNPYEDLEDNLEREVLFYLTIFDAVLLISLLVVHQDYFFIKKNK